MAAQNLPSGTTGALPTGLHDDVITGNRFYNAVNFVADRSLIDDSGGNFNPDFNADRATVATALYRLSGSPAVIYKPVFSDIPSDQSYSTAVIWADETGIIAGFDDGRFGPNEGITRQQFASTMLRFANIKFPQAANLDSFTDNGIVNESDEPGMGWCVARGLIAGTSDTSLEPERNLTRAQLAEALQCFVNLKEDPGNIWVLNPKPTKPSVEATGLAPRVKGGWAGKTVVVMNNYNTHASNTFGLEIESQIKATLSAGETVRLIFIGDLTVIRFQRTTPSHAPDRNWEYMEYEAFLGEVEAGIIKPDAIISAGGF